MPRYGPKHKEATRQRLIETSGRRFKIDGFDGSGISTLVADAGLTNGAFYGHFTSKDDLIASVVAQQLADQAARVAALPPGMSSVEAFVRGYLSPAHRDDLASGCPSAALLEEIGRRDDATRQAYTTGVRVLIEAIARHFDPAEPSASHEARTRAFGLFTVLVASLQSARAVADRDLSDHILTAAYANAMTLATAPLHPAAPTDQDSA